MLGSGSPTPPRSSFSVILFKTLAAIVVGTLSLSLKQLEAMLLIGSFAASALLVFAYPDSPFSQPRNISFGHAIGTIVGLAFLYYGGIS